ncbi:hypothetical protein AB9K26_00295 [Psychroserpens sp. XS_ASV72]|uniref:hypothetical protein n=1 Tax=Psychroserpens sp. XS_ASV72 TaxID=3241293 RepID=UPI0035135C7B
MEKLRIIVTWIYTILAYLFFGGMVFTIVTQYPNWDYDLPNSLVNTNNFYNKADPGTFFQLFGRINIPVFIIMIVLIWKFKKARNLFLFHFLTFFIIGLGTGLLVYPILYELGADDIANRSVEEIKVLLDKFKTLDSIRSVVAIVSIIFLTLGIKEFNKDLYSR